MTIKKWLPIYFVYTEPKIVYFLEIIPPNYRFGVVYKNKEMGFEEAYHRADKALYHVKDSGGKGVAFYEELKK